MTRVSYAVGLAFGRRSPVLAARASAVYQAREHA
jgi:hypothetical protein